MGAGARGAGAVSRRQGQGHRAVPPARPAGGGLPGGLQDRRRDHAVRKSALRQVTRKPGSGLELMHAMRQFRTSPLLMIFSLDLLTEALLFGVLLGCFYAAVSIGLSVSFGLLDVPHVAHPAVMVLGSYCTYLLASQGLDPIVAGVVLMPAFFVLGLLIYRFYYEPSEKRGPDAGVGGLAFFFGVAFIIETGLTLAFGVAR